ncbi:MAG: hypothetical protein EBS29_06345 [Chloroflexia bacterium]|nr:hypothetical protein [Chloroflexia bacterium]
MKKRYWLMVSIAAIAGGLWLQPPRYHSFGDAIEADLRQQGIAVRNIELVHSWPDTVNSISYGANLRMTLISGRVVWGRLECQQQQRNCTYQLNINAMARRPLLDLAEGKNIFDMILQLIAQKITQFAEKTY